MRILWSVCCAWNTFIHILRNQMKASGVDIAKNWSDEGRNWSAQVVNNPQVSQAYLEEKNNGKLSRFCLTAWTLSTDGSIFRDAVALFHPDDCTDPALKLTIIYAVNVKWTGLCILSSWLRQDFHANTDCDGQWSVYAIDVYLCVNLCISAWHCS